MRETVKLSDMFQKSNRYEMAALWKVKNLLIVHAFIALLFASWFFPPTRALWDSLDQFTFLSLNKWIESSSYWQTFWALINHKKTDWFFDIGIALFLLSFIIYSPLHLRKRRIAQALFVIMVGAFTIIVFNHLVFRGLWVIERYSPSLTTPMFTLLSDVVPNLHIKTGARNCFPADHATLGMLFILSMRMLLNRKKAFLATCVGIVFMLPRLIIGAHWLTDIVIGSFSLASLMIAWAFYTPLHHAVVSKIENFLTRLSVRDAQ